MTESAACSRVAELRARAGDARAWSAASRAQAARAAESAATLKGQADRVIERLAARNPQHAGPLRAIGSTAARQRQAIDARRHDFYAARRDGGRVLPERRGGPAAASLCALEAYLGDMAVAQERERIAGELLDVVIRRVFAAGLTLQGAAGQTTEPDVRQRIEEAADDLDEVIQAIRNAVFNLS